MYVYSASDAIIETESASIDTEQSAFSCTLAANVENLTLTRNGAVDGTGNVIIGNNQSNVLRGGDGNDRLNGGEGNDTLDGGAAADNMGGGLGADLYIVDNVGDVAAESAGDGAVDTVQCLGVACLVGQHREPDPDRRGRDRRHRQRPV